MSEFLLAFPAELRDAITRELDRTGISFAAWLEDAAGLKLVADAELAHLKIRGIQGDRTVYDQVLARVPDQIPEVGDELTSADTPDVSDISLKGTVRHYDRPTEPVADDDWDATR